MNAEIGHILLIAAFVLALIQSVTPMVGAYRSNSPMMKLGSQAAILQLICIAGAFALLTASFIASDFSVKLATQHSHSAKPLIYKISGVWGNHEGSILLWVLILALYGAAIPIFGKALPETLRARAIAVQGLLGVGFIAFILWTSNPFWRLNPAPPDGSGLNPLLQDPGLAIHPPFLYLGYVGFSVAFSLACAALIEGKVDAVWAKWLRPWVLIAWSFLTIGITLGSLWAYYELGWGGWWMWDPVENVSFMPWLAGTALLHSVMILGARHKLANWTVLLAIAAFSLSLIGTFIVRSGVLISVHAFAVDPDRGVFLLMLLALFTGGALALYARRSGILIDESGFNPNSRIGALVANNILLCIATAIVFLGTFYPLFIDAISEEKITVGAPYFDKTFPLAMVPLILFMALGPLMAWDRASTDKITSALKWLAPLFALIFIASMIWGKNIWGALGVALGIYLITGTLFTLFRRAPSWAQLKAQPPSFFGFLLAHLGMGVFTIAATTMSIWSEDNIGRLKVGESLSVAPYTFTLTNVSDGQRDNYQYLAGHFSVYKNDRPLTNLRSEQRHYPIRGMVTTEAGFDFGPGDTVFAALSDGDPQKGWIIRVYQHPFVIWIWIGAMMMALGGFISLADKRLHFKEEAA